MRIAGIGPGRRVGEILDMLLTRVLDDPSVNSADALRACIEPGDRDA
jgi:hypothetical protein